MNQRQTYLGYLEALLAAELEEQERNTITRRLNTSIPHMSILRAKRSIAATRKMVLVKF